MNLNKRCWWTIDPDLRDDLMNKPAALKIFMACLFEGISANEMLANHKLYERYGLNPNSLKTHTVLVNRALDNYIYVAMEVFNCVED